jgi:DnaJ-class molecular chaperone
MSGRTFRSFGRNSLVISGGGDTRIDTDCFADEVVVDFPSVAPAVDRMRRSFLDDERTAALSATIQLTPHEAREGATVPLEVPVSATCRECGGRGETWTERCVCCNGSGAELRRHQLHVAVPAGVSDGARFNFTLIPRHDPPTRIELCVLVA